MLRTTLALIFGLVSIGCGGDDRGDAQPGDPCNGTVDCTPGSICFNNVCVTEGTLRFSMSWSVETDIDLHVKTPAGNEISYSARSFDGGTLDVDDCIGGDCAIPGSEHVENVFFTDAALTGVYEFWAVNYDHDVDTPVNLEGFVRGSGTPYSDTAPAAAPGEGPHHMLTY